MTLSNRIELARALFGTDSAPASSVVRITGVADTDSDSGTVTVTLDGGDPIEVGCIGSVSEGDTVTVHVQGTSAQVIGAEGWGDEINALAVQAQADAETAANAANDAVESAAEASGAAQTAGIAAAVAQAAAEAAQGDIDEMENWFYHDTLGAHVLGDSDGYRTDIASTGMQVVDTTDQQAVASFGASGAQICKDGEMRLVRGPSSMAFMVGDGERVAYIEVDSQNNSLFHVTNAVIVDDLRFGGGDWIWKARPGNRNLSLKWIGGSV